MRSSTWRRCRTIRSATSARADVRHQPRRNACASRERQRRPGSGDSSSRRRARCTARPTTDDLLDENAPLRPLTPYAESKVRAEEALPELAADDFIVVSMRNATVYGVVARLRLDIVLNNLAALGAHDGSRSASSATGRRGGRSSMSAISRAPRSRYLMRPTELVRGQAFNVGSGDAELPDPGLASRARGSHRVRGRARIEPSRDPRSYRVDFSAPRAAFPTLSLKWDSRRGSEELVAAYRALRAHDGDVRGAAVRPSTTAPPPPRQRRAGRRVCGGQLPRRCEGLVGVRFIATSIAGVHVVELERCAPGRTRFLCPRVVPGGLARRPA